MQAYDADDGVNAALTYKLGESEVDDLPFTVDSETGWVTTSRVLDREEGHHYEFQVNRYILLNRFLKIFFLFSYFKGVLK